jgi:hypothetical protein
MKKTELEPFQAMRTACVVVLKAGSRAASRFTAIPDKSHAGGFFSGLIVKQFGQNWNRTSDTRIFSQIASKKSAGDGLQHNTASLRLLLSSPDLVRIVLFCKVPGKRACYQILGFMTIQRKGIFTKIFNNTSCRRFFAFKCENFLNG